MAVPLAAFLAVAAVLFAIGIYAVVAQRSAVMILMGVELLLNAVGLNLVAFWRHGQPGDYAGQIFTILVITVGAVEMAVGLALMMMIYRQFRSVQVDEYEELQG